MEFRYPRHPNRLNARHPRIIEDLLELNKAGDGETVTTMITMLRDLYENNLDSRYVKKLKGLPLWELKTKARGGKKGGARIYFFVTEENEAALVNAEIKNDTKANMQKLSEALDVLEAYQEGIKVLDERKTL